MSTNHFYVHERTQSTMNDFLKRQVELRQQAWEQAKALLDAAAAENRELTAEEEGTYARISEDLDARAKMIDKVREDEAREARLDAATRDIVHQVRADAPVAQQNDAEIIRSLASGERRSFTFETRDVLKSSTGSPVPTSFYDQVIMQARLVGPMLSTSTVLNTNSGENLQIPSLAQYSTALLEGEGASIDESDPVFNSFVTLGAYKYAFLVQVSTELLEDSGVNMLSFLAEQVGNELGFRANAVLTTGAGSTEPRGVVTAAAVGGTAGTATGFSGDDLINLYYSLNGAARLLPGVGWMMRGETIAVVRKLKTTDGAYIFQPSLALDTPDTLLGKPIFENPAMALATASTRSVIVGHLPSYFVRQVGGIRLDRSDDFAFANGLVTFRASIRLDGNLPQTSHIKHLLQGS
jgi:HK97 family phage major capsid protein